MVLSIEILIISSLLWEYRSGHPHCGNIDHLVPASPPPGSDLLTSPPDSDLYIQLTLNSPSVLRPSWTSADFLRVRGQGSYSPARAGRLEQGGAGGKYD